MDRVLKNVLVELLVDLPADVDVPVVASAPERIWLWSDLHLSAPSVLLGWCRPFRSVEQRNRHLTGTGDAASAPATPSSASATSPIRMPGATSA